MPMPLGLDHINLYLLQHGNGWVIVDTGLALDQSRSVWERVFEEVIHNEPVVGIIATHFHFDHSGLLGWLSERFRCPVYMTQGEYQSLFISPSESSEANWEFRQFYQLCGVSDAQISEFYKGLKRGHYQRIYPRSYRRLKEGSVLEIGKRRWRVVVGSGHSPEHACLYCEDDQLFISGDQVLPRISSSVSVVAIEPDANPLADWLASLQHLRKVADEVLVLPAHERPFYGLHKRLEQLERHHRLHLQTVVDALGSKSMTINELRPLLFPKVKDNFDLMLATGETLAHLNFLWDEGVVHRAQQGNCYRYGLAQREDSALESNGLLVSA
ncbi:MBL fold metallo-hydrolase [Proteobacteria bacterium 005FR1]|nr:MBL fold metallo-hydrolase [Proteobacteria bacterium 005FR1]